MTEEVIGPMAREIIAHHKDRVAGLEAFVKSARHALQLFDDGYAAEGEVQLRAALAHLDKLHPPT